MKTLPVKMRKNGFNYDQVRRGKRSFVYCQEVTPNVKCYEVSRLKIKPQKTILGKTIPEREIFPWDESFGYWAWSYRNFESAIKKFEALERNEL